jgi:hypothetical protein
MAMLLPDVGNSGPTPLAGVRDAVVVAPLDEVGSSVLLPPAGVRDPVVVPLVSVRGSVPVD